MSKEVSILVVVVVVACVLVGCVNMKRESEEQTTSLNVIEVHTDTDGTNAEQTQSEPYKKDSKVVDVIADPVFGDYGRLIFPVDMGIGKDLELQDVHEILPWYSEVNPDKTVEIVNYMRDKAASGEQIFYDIYSEEEKREDPDKRDTGLFFFRGNPGAKTAVVNAGGGFVYVAGIHDSFPQALELSKKGYNAFALIYRPGAQTACEDLARAIAFLHTHADELQISMDDYSLWGGSAGARMAIWLGTYGTAYFGEEEYPRPATVIMQYTGLSEVTGMEPPVYACVGTNDGIASYRSMEQYISQIKADGTNAEIEVFDGLSHGFGLGLGTVAEGWIDRAVAFWEENSTNSGKTYDVDIGTENYQGFILDNVLHSETEGDIHYNLYVPEDYDGSEKYALFMTLPGYQGLYFQGVGMNVQTEEFGFLARDYNPKMIIVAPQLNDWQDTSARQTIALTEYFLDAYNIDPARVYAEGYSGGGETLSRVMGMRPELFTAYLQCSSQWDGNYDAVVESRTPVYFAIGEHDEYYGSEPSIEAYNAIHKRYEEEGLTEQEIDQLLVLDVKPDSYFEEGGVANQHGGGGRLFVRDETIMGWLFGQVKTQS